MDNEVIESTCDLCGDVFEINPNSFVTVEYATYQEFTSMDDIVYFDESFEGIANNKKGKIEKIEVPLELSNTAICLCPICIYQMGGYNGKKQES